MRVDAVGDDWGVSSGVTYARLSSPSLSELPSELRPEGCGSVSASFDVICRAMFAADDAASVRCCACCSAACCAAMTATGGSPSGMSCLCASIGFVLEEGVRVCWCVCFCFWSGNSNSVCWCVVMVD
jgi:hypothetical protein